ERSVSSPRQFGNVSDPDGSDLTGFCLGWFGDAAMPTAVSSTESGDGGYTHSGLEELPTSRNGRFRPCLHRADPSFEWERMRGPGTVRPRLFEQSLWHDAVVSSRKRQLQIIVNRNAIVPGTHALTCSMYGYLVSVRRAGSRASVRHTTRVVTLTDS